MYICLFSCPRCTNSGCWSIRVQSSSFNGTVLYNHTSVHAIPVAINLVTSARLRMANSLASIHTYVWPWPEQELLDEDATKAAYRMMSIIAIALLLCVPTFGAELVRDRKVYYTHRFIEVCQHICWI